MVVPRLILCLMNAKHMASQNGAVAKSVATELTHEGFLSAVNPRMTNERLLLRELLVTNATFIVTIGGMDSCMDT